MCQPARFALPRAGFEDYNRGAGNPGISPMKYDLVFEGGGAKGMVFVGACEEFFGRGHSFDRLLGTSAGAITAVLLAAGYTPKEMLTALAEKEGDRSVFAGFMGTPGPFSPEELAGSALRRLLDGVDFTFLPGPIERLMRDKLMEALAGGERSRHFLALVDRGGWFSADRFVRWLTARLNTGSCQGSPRAFGGMSLRQFHQATGVELSVVAADTTDERILVLNHRTAPDCPVVRAVRMSMSIPLVWDEVIWQAGWGAYLGRDIAGHAIVDGGLLSNFPIELFLSDAPQVTRLMGSKSANPVLGLLIDEHLPVPIPAGAKGLFVNVNVKPGELKTVQRLQRLVNTATGAHDKMVMEEYRDCVVRLPAKGYGTTEFDMDDARRSALVAAGREAMARHLDDASRPPAPAAPAAPAAYAKSFQLPMAGATDRIAKSMLGLDDDPNL